jgi:hypothetical protein
MDQCLDHGQQGDRQGYGSLRHLGVTQRAHRVAYMREHSCSLSSTDVVRHRCDNPRCINPSHLELGNHQDNMDDMVSRDRSTRGERNATTKLTDSSVLSIRAAYSAGGVTLKELASEYGVSFGQVGHIIRRRTWKHL